MFSRGALAGSSLAKLAVARSVFVEELVGSASASIYGAALLIGRANIAAQGDSAISGAAVATGRANMAAGGSIVLAGTSLVTGRANIAATSVVAIDAAMALTAVAVMAGLGDVAIGAEALIEYYSFGLTPGRLLIVDPELRRQLLASTTRTFLVAPDHVRVARRFIVPPDNRRLSVPREAPLTVPTDIRGLN